MSIKVYKDGAVEWIDDSALNKFLANGWSTGTPGVKKSVKAKVSAKAEVIKKEDTKEFTTEESGDEVDNENYFRNNLTEENSNG